VVFLLTEFPLRQQKSVSFTFRCALIFVDTYAHTLSLKSISIFQIISTNIYIRNHSKTAYSISIINFISNHITTQ